MEVNLYIDTSPKGPRRGKRTYLYILAVQTAKGTADVGNRAEVEDATESQATLRALNEALGRMKCPARITIWLECEYVAGAILQGWPETWKKQGWTTSKRNPVKDAELWQSVLGKMGIHEIEVRIKEHHEYREWMRRELEKRKVAPVQRKGHKNVG